MKKRAIGAVISMIMVFSMLAGCGGASGGTEGNAAGQSAAQEAAEDQSASEEAADDIAADQSTAEEAAPNSDAAQSNESADQTTDTAVSTEEAAAPSEETAASTEEAAAQTADTAEKASAAGDGTESQGLADLAAFTQGGLNTPEEMKAPDEISEDQVAALDRAMRAYEPPQESLLKNEAAEFYYYSQMDETEQAIYDAYLMCAADPTTTENTVVVNIPVDPATREFAEKDFRAFHGMLYDHPELFWLYNGTEAKISLSAPKEQPGNGMYQVYFYYKEPYEDFEDKMNAFNDAAEEFMEEIDLSASDAEIAKQIHDKLIDMVTYDTPVMTDTTKAGFRNLAHTAYGALVEDSDGNAHHAVCDGYSQAYVYLLQQAGIDATVIAGIAGSSTANSVGHAWSIVKLDGDWYEVDVTWDDAGSLDEQVESFKAVDPYSYGYYREALDDTEYRNKVEHYFCNLTTEEIENYKVDDYFFYESRDNQKKFSVLNDSIHIRAGKTTGSFKLYGLVIDLAPEATGTIYKVR